MSEYVTVINRPNQVATVHLASCSFLGPTPLKRTDNAERILFGDGLDALAAAQDGMPSNYGFCGHCLARFKHLREK